MPALIGRGVLTAANPLTIAPWLHAFWASDPSWTPPADGGEVTTWRDAGSAATDAAKLSTTGPTFRASAAHYAGRPVVQFKTSNTLRTTAGSTSTSARTVVAVGNIDTATATMVDGASANSTGRLAVQNTTVLLVSRNTNVGVTGDTYDSDPHLWVCVFDGASSTFHLDNVALTVGSSPGTTAAAGMTLGSLRDGTASMAGSIAFAAVLDGAITSTQRDDLWGWASGAYGLRAE